MSALKAIKDFLFSDLDPSREYDELRPLLAHYCTVGTAEKILKGREVWLSNPLLMNDIEEVRFGILSAGPIFSRITRDNEHFLNSPSLAVVARELERLHLEFDTDGAIDVYAFCFSRHKAEDNDGLLSMWRGYGENGKGVALVFDTAKLPLISDSPFILAEVKYATHQQRLLWLEEKIGEFIALICRHDLSEAELVKSADMFFERLKLFSLFTKHEGFSEESEWRLAYIKTRDVNRTFLKNMSYLVGTQGIEPKLKIKLGELLQSIGSSGDDDIIDRIILGPTQASLLSTTAFRRMLEAIERPNLISKTTASTIPFRPSPPQN